LIAVKLRIDDITAEEREISFVEPEQDINRIIGAGPVQEYHVTKPVNVTLSFYRAGTELFLKGEVAAMTTAVCARCVEEFTAPIRRPFRCVLAPKVVGYDEQADLRADDLEFSIYEGDEIDLAPVIREQVLLALTARPICREDCRGLCPRCGTNLNEGGCGCQAKVNDSPLSVLHTLKVSRN
jgi:uncharacterized protein